MKIELVVNDEDVSQVLSAIVRGAKTGAKRRWKYFYHPHREYDPGTHR